jgi:hypothetical protein
VNRGMRSAGCGMRRPSERIWILRPSERLELLSATMRVADGSSYIGNPYPDGDRVIPVETKLQDFALVFHPDGGERAFGDSCQLELVFLREHGVRDTILANYHRSSR